VVLKEKEEGMLVYLRVQEAGCVLLPLLLLPLPLLPLLLLLLPLLPLIL
jgi:hypothetical protein